MRLELREAAPDDAPALALMNRRLIEDERHVNPMSLSELETRMREWLERGEYRALLFYTEPAAEPPAGYILYQLRRDYYFPERAVAYIRHFYVERERRRRGIGRMAFEVIVRECFPADCILELEVLASNPAGRDFWTSLGFEPRYTVMRREAWPREVSS